ncbi:MAG: hypothetical protein V4519_01620 [Patescibacteria group bacterium]
MIFSHYKRFLRFKPLVGIALFIVLIIGVSFLISNPFSDEDKTVAIILSPHAGDAYVGLGGLIDQKGSNVIVVDVFNGTDTGTTTPVIDSTNTSVQLVKLQYSERDGTPEEISISLSQDIQALISGNKDKIVSVYAPSYFTDDITPKEHAIVSEAFRNVASNYPDMNVQFYVYEDFPYINQFNLSSVVSVQRHIENTFDIRFTKVEIPLTKVPEGSESIRAYKQTRCGENPNRACEIVYKLER